jgi:hypothetical protein
MCVLEWAGHLQPLAASLFKLKAQHKHRKLTALLVKWFQL